MWGNPDVSVSSQPQYETDLPFGRDKNVIFYGMGDETSISLSGEIVDKDNGYAGMWGKKAAWDNVRNNQGVYIFRTPKGDLYKVGLKQLDIKNGEARNVYDISASMVEVV